MKKVLWLLLISVFLVSGCGSLQFSKVDKRDNNYCSYCKQVVTPVPNSVPGARLKCSKCGHFLEEGRVKALQSEWPYE